MLQFRGVTASTQTTGTSKTVNKPSGVVDGDLMLCYVGVAADVEMTMPAGWTLAHASAEITGTTNIRVYKKTASSEGASYNITHGSSQTFSAGIVAWYSDDGHTIAVDTAANQTNASSTNRSFPTVSTSRTGAALNYFASLDTNVTSTPDAACDERWDSGTTVRAHAMTEQIDASGTTSARTATGTASASKVVTLALVETAVGLTIRNIATANTALGSSLAISKPTSTATGDMMLLQIVTSSSVTITGGVSDWTLLETQSGSGSDNAHHVYYRVAQGGDSSWTVTTSAVTNMTLNIIGWYSAAAWPIVFDDSDKISNGTTTSHVAQAVTTTKANAALNCFYSGSNTFSGTAPSGTVERYDRVGSSASYLMTEIVAATGSTGTRTMTGSSVTSDSISVAIAEDITTDGVLAVTLAAITFSGSGTVESTEITGVLAVTLDAITFSTTATAETVGALAAILDAITFSNTGIVESTGALTVTLGAITFSGPGYNVATPSDLTATTISDTQIDLAWTDNADNETGYEIQVSTDGATWGPMGFAAANATSFSATGLLPNTLYYFRVRAFILSPLVFSAWSNTASATTEDAPQVIVHVDKILGVDWSQSGVYEEESANVISARGSIHIAPPGQNITTSGGQVAQATIVLNNTDDRYSPLITGGPLSDLIAGGKMYRTPLYFRVSIDSGATYHTIFTGLMKIPQNKTLTPNQLKTIDLDCRGREEQYLNYKLSTTILDTIAFQNYSESQLIAYILYYAGVSGDIFSADTGLYSYPWFWMDEASVIETCWQLAASAGGRFYCTKDGVFAYEAATHWLVGAHATSRETITRGKFANLTVFYDDNSLASKVIAKARLLEPGESGELWTAEEPLSLSPGASETVVAELGDPAYQYESITYDARTTGGLDMSGSVTLEATYYAQRVEMVFTNTHPTYAATIRNLKITGSAIEETSTATVTETSSNDFWTAPTRATASLVETINNPFVHRRDQAKALAQQVLGRQEVPPLFYKLFNVRGDPERQIGDRITISDSELMTEDRDAFIIGIEWRFSAATGFKQDLTCIDSASVAPYIDADIGYFVLDTNTLDELSDNPGRLYY